MKLHLDRLSAGLQTQPNLPWLLRAFSRSDTGRITGFVTLTQTSFLKQFRLMFFGTGEFSETVLCGPTFDALLLEVPALTLELREVVDEFLKQIRQLDDGSGSQTQEGASGGVIEQKYVARCII